MRRENLRRTVIIALVVAAAATAIASARPIPPPRTTGEYFSDDEVDFIRESQGLSPRITALLKLANIRLVTLGMREKSKEDKELEKRIAEIHEEFEGKPATPPVKPQAGKQKQPPPPVAGPYLNDLTRLELLRGYMEAIDEITRDIDSAYRQKLEVHGVLEQLEKFCSAAVPLLRRFQAGNAAELQAIGDARSTTQEALESTQDALKKIPRTEKGTNP